MRRDRIVVSSSRCGRDNQVRIMVTATILSLMAYEFEFLQCDVRKKLFLYFKTSIASNKMCPDSEESCLYDQVGHASAVIKMQALSEC